MPSKLFKDLRDTEYNHLGKAVYQGDPIFVVDFKTLTIKAKFFYFFWKNRLFSVISSGKIHIYISLQLQL